ncbi:MAG: transporter related [Bryobacterales bacterium]|nr:transporter related [Bryobacterales bacterium]
MLEARLLTKYYDHTPAVQQVSFTVRPGEILGFLGPNGAGKSTTVKMLTGLIEPSEGQIFYQGKTVYDDFTAFQRCIGYVPEEAHLYPHLSGHEYLQLVGRLRGMPRSILEPKIDEFIRLFGLWNDRHTALSSYSKGMRQKILLSAALLHDPEVLILDEPFSGLDVTSALMLRSLLRALAKRGKMILYSSHVLEVVEKICSNVLILRKGEVVAYDSIDRLRELMQQPSLEGVFSQLAQVDDGDELANRIVDAMSKGGGEPPPPNRPVATGLRLYRSLARAFPYEFRNVYGDELLQVTEEAIEPIWRSHGLWGLARLLTDIAVRVPIEHFFELCKDLRYSLRQLASSPGFTAVALVSLSLGICIATCAISEMNGMVLRSIPRVEKPGELVALQMPVAYPSYRRYGEHTAAFTSTLAYVAPVPFDVSFGGPAERIWGHLVTPSYFSALGVHPEFGRLFDQQDERPGGPSPVVVSYRFWQQHLDSDRSIIGKTLRINSQLSTVVGVGPEDFLGVSPLLAAADLWMPVSVGGRVAPELTGDALERRDRAMFHVIGRLRPGVAMGRAEAELDAEAQQIEQDNGDPDRTKKGRRISLVDGGKLLPLRKQDQPFFTSFLTVMAGLVMLIACANVANLMLARVAGRRKEVAIRIAMGARRSRIVRQLLTESMLVAAAAAVPGYLLSMWLMKLSSQIRMPLPIPVTFDFQPDGRVLLFTIGVTALTGIACGLMPALQTTNSDLTTALKEGPGLHLHGRGRVNLRNVLIVSQFAGSLTLLAILGLLALGIQTTMGIQTGFNPANLYLISLDPVRDGLSGEQANAFFQKLLERVKSERSVSSAGLTESVPVSLGGGSVMVSTADGGSNQTLSAVKHVVGKDYFETTGIPLLAGHAFRKEDETNRTAAIIISRELAGRFWRGDHGVGRRVEIGNGEIVPAKILPGTYDYRAGTPGGARKVFEVVGVANDVAEGLVVQKPRPAVYLPLRQADYTQPAAEGVTLMVRAVPGADVVRTVREKISAMDARITPFNIRSMPEQIDQFMAPLRIASWTYGLIGFFGLVLASVGLAGMTAYSVTRRAKEIGIRIAVGARRGDVVWLVMKEGLVLVVTGTGLGLAGAWAGSRLLSAMNSSVGNVTSTSTSDPVVLLGAPLVLGVLALLACYVPARKSLRVDPVVALRQE